MLTSRWLLPRVATSPCASIYNNYAISNGFWWTPTCGMWPKKPISENSSKQSPGDGTTSNASSKALHDTHGPRLTTAHYIYIEGYNGGRESIEKCAVVSTCAVGYGAP